MASGPDNPFRRAHFLMGATSLAHMPRDAGREVAFAGRSNVGKSSLINTVADQRHLVRTSRTPGRTREINFFEVTPQARCVDLPGYGFARVARSQRESWGELMEQYLTGRGSLVGVVSIMDIRHPFKEMDLDLVAWLSGAGLPCHVVLNKADKLSFSACQNALRQARKRQDLGPGVTVQVFSSVSRAGVDELRKLLWGWLAGEEKKMAPVHRGR